MIVNRSTAAHYKWGLDCDGWVLSAGETLSVIEELMPPATAEHRHFHARARQFFYVIEGSFTMELDGVVHRLEPGTGIEIPPGVPHQARNDSIADVRFLVTSTPTTRGDRVDLA